jgi:hypothetical protein
MIACSCSTLLRNFPAGMCTSVSHQTDTVTGGSRMIAAEQGTESVATRCFIYGGQKKPHVLFVVLDDAGWNDFDWMGSERNQFDTPYMRKLAQRGILLASHCEHQQ